MTEGISSGSVFDGAVNALSPNQTGVKQKYSYYSCYLLVILKIIFFIVRLFYK